MIELNLDNESLLDKNSLKTKIIEYFNEMGFKKVKVINDTFRIQRGSKLMNSLTLNPLNWKSEILIDIKEKDKKLKVKSSFRIYIENQFVTKNEINVWEKLFENYEKILSQTEFKSSEIINENNKAKKINLKIIIILVLTLLISTIISTLIAIKANFPLIFIFPLIASILSLYYSIKYVK